MSIYFGLILVSPITNQSRYKQTIEEIQQYLSIHNDAVVIIDHENILKFKSLDGSNDFWLPKYSNNLHTNYYRIQEDDDENDYNEKKQRYIEIVWECLCIVKENFPSKIGLFQENLEDFDATHWQSELLRRQLNIIQARMGSEFNLKTDEIEDVFNVLETCLQTQNSKGILICLGILQADLVLPINLVNLQGPSLLLLQNLSEEVYLQTLRSDNYMSKDYEAVQQTASNILTKVLTCQSKRGVNEVNFTPINSLQILRMNEKFKGLEQTCTAKVPTVALINSIEFQLKESKDLERICYILDLIINRSAPLYDIMSSRHFEYLAIDLIVPNYIDKLYEDTNMGKHCLFHTMIFMLINRTLQGISYSNENQDQFTLYLQTNRRVDNIFHLSKEAISYWIDVLASMEGKSISNELYTSLLDFYNILGSLPSRSFNIQLKVHYQEILSIISEHLGLQTYQHTSRTLHGHLQDIHQISPKLAELVDFILKQ